MAASTWLARASHLAAVVLLTAAMAGCANNQNQPSSQLTGDGSVTPGTHRDFSVNVGDIVYFTTDSSDLSPEAT
ncbi:MAG: peptidoglycan-associated lipoprotein Pal, partial [Terriglobia bacterium]